MEFNSEQTEAIEHSAKNLLVLAGAGTGKTRTIIGKTRALLKQGVPANQILLVTFTRRAAREIRERLTEVCGEDAKRIVAGTFHYFCLREMRARRKWFDLEQFTIMDRDDQLQLMKLARADVDSGNTKLPTAGQLVSYYSYARNTNQSVDKYLDKFTDHGKSEIELISTAFELYKQKKLENGYFDYDDILHRFAKVLYDNPDVCAAIAGKYQHVLVDEMQDTNPLQWLILESLSKHAQLFCVGDDAQSIYAFRGADFRNVHSFASRLPDAQVHKLRENYRSTQEILDISNWLLANSRLKYNKDLRAYRGLGIRPKLLDFDTDIDEGDWVAKQIIRRHKNGDSWRDHMVLCRTAYSARATEAQLIERGIPYRFIGGIGILQTAHVRDLLSALRVTVNHRDELAWMRYLTLWPGIGEVTATRLVGMMRQASDAEVAIEKLADTKSGRDEILLPLREALRYTEAPHKAINHVTKAMSELLERKHDKWDSRKKDFELLEQLAQRHSTVASFIETYTLDPISATEVTQEDEHDVVSLITVHSAKGTEAKTCFVIAAQPGNYPHQRSLDDPDEIEEERRVLYVALTRAKDELFISRAMSSRGYGRMSWNASAGAEYFLEYLPNKLVAHEYKMAGRGHYFDSSSDVIG